MKILEVKNSFKKIIKGPLVLSPEIFSDKRGFFYESWNVNTFKNSIKQEVSFVQDNHSKSSFGVLRGLHYQLPPSPQAKLVRCTSGEIFDVIVDVRKSSPTYLSWFGITLSSENYKQLWIPSGFAHGFLTISEWAEVQYKVDNLWDKNLEKCIKWDDKLLNIKWPLDLLKFKSANLSSKDFEAMSITEAENNNFLFP